jgi:hypothetical protein
MRFGIVYLLSFSACNINDHDCPGINLPPDNHTRVTVTQGVWGNVWFWEGNFQPYCPSGKVIPVVRQIYIHEGTPPDSVESDGRVIFRIKTRLITVVNSDGSGFYEASLDSGAYSLFIKEDSVYYADGGDDSFLSSVYVVPGKVTKRQLDITYKAVY